MSVRLMLIDGRPVRAGRIAALLRARSGPEIVARPTTPADALAGLGRHRPDLVAVADELVAGDELGALQARLEGGRAALLNFGGDAEAAVDAILGGVAARARAAPGAARPPPTVVCIGASTGGLPALREVLAAFPADCPATLIVQHILGGFTQSVAERLDHVCAAHVAEAREGDAVRPGRVHLAPSDGRHLAVSGRVAPSCRLVSGPPVTGHRPSVDALFGAAAENCDRVIGVLLTGMGRDGAEGLLKIRRAGGATIAQDRESSTVYGMPRAAAEMGAAEQVLPLRRIGPAILDLASGAEARAGGPAA